MAMWSLFTTFLFTLLVGIPIILVALISKTGRTPYKLGRFYSWLVMKTNRVKLQVVENKNVFKQKSYIYISNHLSNLDPLAVSNSVPNPLRFIGKASLAKIPVFGWAAKMARTIFIDRTNSIKAVETINKSIRELKNGISAFFFAEGTRSTDGKMKPFKKGGIALAIKAKLPIVPVTIINSDKLLRKNSLKIKKGVLNIIIGDPIDTSRFTMEDVDKVCKMVEEIIRKTFNQYQDVFHKEAVQPV